MPEQPGFSTYDPEQRTLSRAPFRYRADEPDTQQVGFTLALPDDCVVVRRAPSAGDCFAYLAGGEIALLVRAGELSLLPAAEAAARAQHPTTQQWQPYQPELAPAAAEDE